MPDNKDKVKELLEVMETNPDFQGAYTYESLSKTLDDEKSSKELFDLLNTDEDFKGAYNSHTDLMGLKKKGSTPSKSSDGSSLSQDEIGKQLQSQLGGPQDFVAPVSFDKNKNKLLPPRERYEIKPENNQKFSKAKDELSNQLKKNNDAIKKAKAHAEASNVMASKLSVEIEDAKAAGNHEKLKQLIPEYNHYINEISKSGEQLKSNAESYNIAAKKINTIDDYFIKSNIVKNIYEKQDKEKQGSVGGAIWNSLVNGYTNTLESSVKTTVNLMNYFAPEVMSKEGAVSNDKINETIESLGIKENLDKKLKSVKTTDEYINKLKEQSTIAEGGLGLTESIYPMITPKMSGMFALSFSDGIDEINKAKPELSDGSKMLYGSINGAISLVAEELGLNQIIGNKYLTQPLVNKVLSKLIIDGAGKKITDKAIFKATKEIVGTLGAGYIEEFESGALEYAGQEALKQTTDLLEGQDDFKNQGTDLIGNIIKAGHVEGIGGVIMQGAIRGVGTVKNSSNKIKAEEISKKIEALNMDLENPYLTESTKASIKLSQKKLTEDLLELIQKDTKLEEHVNPAILPQIEEIDTSIESNQAIINDPNTSKDSKEIAQQELEDLGKLRDDLVSNNQLTEEEIQADLLKLTEDDKTKEYEGATVQRLSEEEERGRDRAGEINAESAILTERVHSAVAQKLGINPSDLSKGQIVKEEESYLEEYAKEKGVWVENLNEKYGDTPDDAGQENEVFYSEDGKTVTKLNSGVMNDNWLDFTDRIALHNHLFPEAPYTIVGYGKDSNGNFKAILEQPFIHGTDPTDTEIETFMSENGFERITEDGDKSNDYINKTEGLIVEDLHRGNIVKTDSGKLIVIDPIVSLDTKEKGFEGTREIGGKPIPIPEPTIQQEVSIEEQGTKLDEIFNLEKTRNSKKSESVKEDFQKEIDKIAETLPKNLVEKANFVKQNLNQIRKEMESKNLLKVEC